MALLKDSRFTAQREERLQHSGTKRERSWLGLFSRSSFSSDLFVISGSFTLVPLKSLGISGSRSRGWKGVDDTGRSTTDGLSRRCETSSSVWHAFRLLWWWYLHSIFLRNSPPMVWYELLLRVAFYALQLNLGSSGNRSVSEKMTETRLALSGSSSSAIGRSLSLYLQSVEWRVNGPTKWICLRVIMKRSARFFVRSLPIAVGPLLVLSRLYPCSTRRLTNSQNKQYWRNKNA